MAFGKKFYSSYKSNNNLDYYLEVWIEGHTGGNTELTMGAGGPVIEYETDQEDRFSPIISSSCKIPYLVEDNIDSAFVDTLRTTYQERQVYIHIYRASSSTYHTVAPLWSGFLVMDLGEGQDKSFPYVQELKFVDGLALLKDIDFVNLNVTGGTPPYEERVQGNYDEVNMYFGPGTYIYWFREILAKTGASLTDQGSTLNYGFTTSVNWYNGDMNNTGQSSDPLHKTKCQVSMFHRKDDQEVYFPDNCYNVLKELLRHWGARITYWKHEFYIVQIPEYITGESGTIDNPQNNNSRVYSNLGTYQGSQDHLGSTYWTRYFQEISNTKISKLTGTKYEYLPIVKQVNADFLSFSSKSVFGGFPFGATALDQEVFQGTLNSPSTADFLWLSIPLDWAWDCPNFPQGHESGWWSSIKFNFYASDGTTTYYLQFDSTSQTLPYYWVDSANWTPLGPRSPRYIISSKSLNVTAHVGFEQKIPFKDSSGNAITMTGAWSFYLDLHSTGTATGYGNSGSNPGCFYLNFSGYTNPPRMRNPNVGVLLPTLSGNVNSGTVSWSNSLQDSQGSITISTITNPSGFNAGTSQDDIRFATTSPFLGLLQLLTDGQSAAFGQSYNTLNTSSAAAKANSDQFDFGRLLWGDSTEFARSSLQVFDGSNYVNTTASGLWGRGTLTGSKTFTQLLLDEFLYGQTKIIISPSMRLIVGEQNKNETQGSATRPRYVNPIGKLRETRDGTDPEYFFRRGSFYTLLDEWDYEGYQIIRNEVTTTNQNNSIGSSGGNQSNAPNNSAMMTNPTTQALAQNSPLAYISQTIPATGSNVAVNGNFNVATGWTLGTGWTIDTTEKKAKFAATGSTSELVQSVLTQELTYQINFQVEVTAGTLLVKAGTSGQTQTITSSGDYSIYLTCEGSSDIKFQAGTTFTGSITYITLRDQKSLSSVPINEIGSAVFKTGDTFNLINSNSDEILALTVTSNQGSSDTSISVSSTPLYDDIDAGSYLLINQDDLSAQYQNKTKGTVGGFDITANSIDSGSVAISSYIDDDSFGTASATSLATSESIKAYVDTQVGSADTLQEVTDNGNTTTNSVNIGSSTSPAKKLTVTTSTTGDGIQGISTDGYSWLKLQNDNSTTFPVGTFRLYYGTSQSVKITALSNEMKLGDSQNNMTFFTASSERMRLTSTGRLGIGTTSPLSALHVFNGGYPQLNLESNAGSWQLGVSTGNDFAIRKGSSGSSYPLWIDSSENIGIGQTSPAHKLDVTGYIRSANTGTDSNTKYSQFLGRHYTNSEQDVLAISTESTSSNNNIYVGGGFSSRNSATTIRFYTASNNTTTTGSERMRLTSDGRLGIGLTNPSRFLSVNSANENFVAQFTSNDDKASILLEDDDTLNYIHSQDGYLSIGGGNALSTTNLNINSTNGNTGFGTVTPSEKIHVVGDALITGDSHADAFKPAVSGNPIKFKNFGSTELARITSGGNFGINESNPTNKLEVFGGGNYGLLVNTTSSVLELNPKANGYGNIGSSSLSWWEVWAKRLRYSGNIEVYATSLDVSGNFSATGTGSFTGQVTIPATPVASTDAASKGYVDAQVGSADTLQEVTDNGNTTTNSIRIGSSSAPAGGVGLHVDSEIRVDGNDGVATKKIRSSYFSSSQNITIESGSSAAIVHNIGSSEKMRLTSTGLGIGNSSPTEELSVSGDANITGKLAVGSSSAHPSFAFYNQLTSYFNGAVTIDDSLTQTGGSTSTFSGDILPASNIGSSLGSSSKSFLYTYTYVLQSAGILQLGAGGAEKARITSGGSLLLGTTTDNGYKLEVNGSVFLNDGASELILNNSTSSELRYGTSCYFRANGSQAIVDAPAIHFKNNGNDSARITSGGNLLLGTTTDSGRKLHIHESSGSVYLQMTQGSTGTTSNDGFQIAMGATQVNLINRENGPMLFDTNNSTKMSLLANGNLLIGTTTDDGSSKLQVEGDITAQEVSATASSYSAGQSEIIYKAQRTGGAVAGDWSYDDGTTDMSLGTSTSHSFSLKTGNTRRLTINNSGNTTFSGHVVLGTTGNRLEFTNGNVGLYRGEGANLILGGYDGIIFRSSNSGITTQSERMRLTSDGELLIGQTSSDANLVVNSGSWPPSKPVLRLNNGFYNYLVGYSSRVSLGHSFQIYQNSTVANINWNSGILKIGTQTNNNLEFYTNDTTKMTLTSGGNVLIGTTSDDGSSKLQVAGNIKVGDGNSFLAGTSNDIEIVHVNDQSFMINNTGDLIFEQRTDDRDIYFKCDDGSGGTETYFYLDGSASGGNPVTIFPDSSTLRFGNSGDLQLYHDAANSYIAQTGTGDLYIRNTTNDKDVILQSDNGSGGITAYITLDGSQETINLQKTVLIGTTTNTGSYKIDVAGKQRVQDTLELDDVLMLNAISTPSDPADGKSVIYMDSADGGIKCKINVEGTVVTRTIASFE